MWQREIMRRDAESESQGSAPDSEPAFATVQLVDDGKCAAAVEIVAGNGYVIRVSEQATTEHVRRVLQAMNQLDEAR